MAKELATFGGGCFWCMVQPFEETPGIISVVSGYSGGHIDNPTYEQVKAGTSGHAEVVQIEFDNEVMSYDDLVTIYWQQTDPTDEFGQFVDKGSSYRPVIFYHSPVQKEVAEQSKKALQESGRFNKPIVTSIEPLINFYPAEEYHQQFYKKSTAHYKRYRSLSGRNEFLEENWKK